MTGNKHTLFAFAMAALILTGALAGAMASPALADSTNDSDGEDSVVDTLFTGESDQLNDDSGLDLNVIQAAVMGWVEVNTPLGEDPEKASATEYAENVQNTFNENSSHIRNWTNARADGNSEYDVFRIKFKDESGNSEWLFLVTDVNSSTGNYTSAEAMNLTEFRETDREVDHTYTLEPKAARNADRELAYFISEYAKPGKDVNREYLAGLSGYRGHVDGTDLPGTESGNSGAVAGWFPW